MAEHVVEGGAEPADLGVWGGVGEGSGMAISPLARGSPAIARPTVWTLT
ncbi:hypothetical protein JGS39_19915 [Streptomyces sp. P01-B04]|nr:hypothetical protein [Streptomyces poriferorum]MBW5257856.1 hypothetical protein [Streptomyces poriferorum]